LADSFREGRGILWVQKGPRQIESILIVAVENNLRIVSGINSAGDVGN
jgi:hypothetical protein